MTPPKKKGEDGHQKAREKICVVCLRKSNKKLSPNQKKGLQNHSKIFNDISPEDPRVPSGICHDCRKILQLKIHGKGKDKPFKIPQGFSFHANVIIPKTRSVIILGNAHSVPENSFNTGQYYKNTKFWTIKNMKSLDHEMKHIDTGIMTCKCSYPCTDCLVFHTDLDTCGRKRKMADLANFFEKFMAETGGNSNLCRFYYCQKDRPWIYETLQEHKNSQDEIFDHLLPSPLHDFLGIGNKFVHTLGEFWPELIAAWVKFCNVSKEGYWGGHFLGNALRTLFENISFLEDEYGYAKEPLMAPFIKAMRSFDAVREGVMGMELDPDYAQLINQFKTDYLALKKFGFSVTLKAHCIFYHYIDWLDKWQLPLGLVGEQAGEAVHCRFNRFIQCKQCSHLDSKDFPENLLRVTVAWSSLAAITFDE